MTRWTEFTEELDRWGAAGRDVPFWWRDDDATDVTPALERLLELAITQEVPLALAVVPEPATTALAKRLRGLPPGIAVLQHGFAHRDHSDPSPVKGPKRKKIELGGNRPPDEVSGDLQEGRAKLRSIFGDRFRDILVPPWNRVDLDILTRLPALGFEGLSTFGPMEDQEDLWGNSGFIQANSTIDIMQWRPSRGFLGEDTLLDQILTSLRRQRAHGERRGDGYEEPLGLMTHHLVHDEDCWTFVSHLLKVTRAHRAARWLTVDDIFFAGAPQASPATAASLMNATVHRYPPRALIGDYIRVAVGLLVGVGILSVTPMTWPILVIFGGLTVLFLVFGYRTVQRHLTEVTLDETGIGSSSFFRKSIDWDQLSRMRLRFYGTRRQTTGSGSGGFMELKLWDRSTTMTFDSALDGFEYLAWRATKAARDNGVSLDPASAGNLLQLGIDADSDQPPPGSPLEERF